MRLILTPPPLPLVRGGFWAPLPLVRGGFWEPKAKVTLRRELIWKNDFTHALIPISPDANKPSNSGRVAAFRLSLAHFSIVWGTDCLVRKRCVNCLVRKQLATKVRESQQVPKIPSPIAHATCTHPSKTQEKQGTSLFYGTNNLGKYMAIRDHMRQYVGNSDSQKCLVRVPTFTNKSLAPTLSLPPHQPNLEWINIFKKHGLGMWWPSASCHHISILYVVGQRPLFHTMFKGFSSMCVTCELAGWPIRCVPQSTNNTIRVTINQKHAIDWPMKAISSQW